MKLAEYARMHLHIQIIHATYLAYLQVSMNYAMLYCCNKLWKRTSPREASTALENGHGKPAKTIHKPQSLKTLQNRPTPTPLSTKLYGSKRDWSTHVTPPEQNGDRFALRLHVSIRAAKQVLTGKRLQQKCEHNSCTIIIARVFHSVVLGCRWSHDRSWYRTKLIQFLFLFLFCLVAGLVMPTLAASGQGLRFY